jgi:hypothetical protein
MEKKGKEEEEEEARNKSRKKTMIYELYAARLESVFESSTHISILTPILAETSFSLLSA